MKLSVEEKQGEILNRAINIIEVYESTIEKLIAKVERKNKTHEKRLKKIEDGHRYLGRKMREMRGSFVC